MHVAHWRLRLSSQVPFQCGPYLLGPLAGNIERQRLPFIQHAAAGTNCNIGCGAAAQFIAIRPVACYQQGIYPLSRLSGLLQGNNMIAMLL